MPWPEILPVTAKPDLNRFIELPWSIYKNNPTWVPPLKSEVRALLDTARHPFWKFSESVMFLARRGEQVVGRIAGIIDGNYNRYHKERSGAWGFFESVDDPEVAAALTGSVEEWLKGKGMDFVRGPFCPSTNYEIGMLIEGYEFPPVIMMPYNPPYYPNLIEQCGYQKEKDLFSLHIERDDRPTPRTERLVKRLMRKSEISFRTIDMKNLDAEIRLVKEIYDDSWADNWGFVPMTDEEIVHVGKGLKKIGDPDLVFFVYYAGEPAGVAMVLPDINPLLKRLNGRIGITGIFKFLLYKKEITGIRATLVGFKKRFQKLGLPLVVFDYMNRVAREKGYHYLELGWTLEDNEGINQYVRECGGRINTRYRVFGKALR
ncbi:MAG: acyl-CoA N-acyltransferase [Pseudomonadota bacterium]